MITVKEEFLASVKTKRAYKLGGGDAILLWLNLKGYVAAGNTGGFIPEEAIEDLPLLPKSWKRAMVALIDCGKLQSDGSRGAGLVDKVDLGYKLHDYEDHGTPVEVEDERRRKAREQKAARRLALRHERGDCGDDCPHCVRGQNTGQRHGQTAGQSADKKPDGPARTAPRAPAGVRPYASGHASVRQRDPQPSPARSQSENSKGNAVPGDLSGTHGVEESTERRAGLAERLQEFQRETGKLPRPRHDPMQQRIPVGDWFPSTQHLDWQRETGLPDEAFDMAIVDAKNKLSGGGTIEFWDGKIAGFFETALKRHRERSGAPVHVDPEAKRRKAERDAAERERIAEELRRKVQGSKPVDEAAARAAVEAFEQGVPGT